MMRALMLFLLCAATAHAEPLGRLFYTPEERARIDQGTGHAPQAEARPAPPVINGIVRRSNGEGTVWIDGEAQHGRIRQSADAVGEAPAAHGADATDPSAPRISIRIHRP